MSRARAEEFDHKTEVRLAANPWLARIAETSFLRRPVKLALGRDLFASGWIDNGTERLLRLLAKPGSPLQSAPNAGRRRRILDLGCGAGTIGVMLARGLGDERPEVVMTDRDHLAVVFARENARLNSVAAGEGDASGGVRVLEAGLGYDPVQAAKEAPFDLIVSNVPASGGDNGLYEIVYGAGPHLAKGGRVAIVYVTPLDATMTSMRAYHAQTYGPVEVESESRGKEHVAQVLRFPDGLPEFESDDPLVPWKREDSPPTVLLDEDLPPLPQYAVHDVPEFDTPHYETPLLAKLVGLSQPVAGDDSGPSVGERILVLNPRHGFLATLLAHERRPREIALLSRDSLETAVATLNVRAALADWQRTGETAVGVPPSLAGLPWLPAAAAEPGSGFDVITGHLNWREGPEALAATLAAFRAALAPGGRIVLACRSGQLEGLRHAARDARLRDGRTIAKKGNSAVVLKPKSS